MNEAVPVLAQLSRVEVVLRDLQTRTQRAWLHMDVGRLREISAQADGAGLVSGDKRLYRLSHQTKTMAAFLEDTNGMAPVQEATHDNP